MYATNFLEPTPPSTIEPDLINDVLVNDLRIDAEIVNDVLIDAIVELEFDEIVAPVTVRRPQARCADGHGTLTHLFFSDVPLDLARAKAICGKCGLSESCLEGALARAEPWGVWGGELIENGRIVVNKRPRGRPPKHPRPVVEVDEVPIPPHLVA